MPSRDREYARASRERSRPREGVHLCRVLGLAGSVHVRVTLTGDALDRSREACDVK